MAKWRPVWGICSHALKVRTQIKSSHKIDSSDALGLAMLLRNGTLPEVWVPSGKLRDLRGLMRCRLRMRRIPTMSKNQIHAALRRYGIVARRFTWRLGDVERFATAEKFAGYCGPVSRVHSSGRHSRQGRSRKECNALLKWAFVEAAWHMMRTKQEYREPQPTAGMLQVDRATGRPL